MSDLATWVTAGECDHPDGFERGLADVIEQPLACPENDRHDVQVELVEQSGGEVLPHGARAAGDRDVLPAGRGRAGLLERGLDPVGDEREAWCRPASTAARAGGG